MFTYEHLLSVALLSAPADALDASLIVPWCEAIRPSLMAVAIDAEILDHREREHYLTSSHSPEWIDWWNAMCGIDAEDGEPWSSGHIAEDLAILQARYHRSAFLPHIWETERFPSRETINEFLLDSRAFNQQLRERIEIDQFRSGELWSILKEAEHLYHIWDLLRDAQCDCYYITVRREALGAVSDLIGTAAFYRGQMPPHVPSWHFPRR